MFIIGDLAFIHDAVNHPQVGVIKATNPSGYLVLIGHHPKTLAPVIIRKTARKIFNMSQRHCMRCSCKSLPSIFNTEADGDN
mmetsp:Transcript_19704/g.27704  ORF Transcript_19704/g.27704 Transcript_19704/m.27704 type:complete len:82 (+) Transcript_19704:310-555(+)